MKKYRRKVVSLAILLASILSRADLFLVDAQAFTIVPANESFAIPFSDFYDQDGNIADPRIPFTTGNFQVSSYNVIRGEDFITDVVIENQQVVVKVGSSNLPALPSAPNVIIKNLEIRATKTVREDGQIYLRAGQDFSYDGIIELGVGHNDSIKYTAENSKELPSELKLNPEDLQHIQWDDELQPQEFTVEFGEAAYGTTRVYGGQATTFEYCNSIASPLLNKNRGAFMTSVDIRLENLISPMKIYFSAYEEDYIYTNRSGTLELSPVQWDGDLERWYIVIAESEHFIISDQLLVSAPYIIGGSVVVDVNVEEPSEENNYHNPSTGVFKK